MPHAPLSRRITAFRTECQAIAWGGRIRREAFVAARVDVMSIHRDRLPLRAEARVLIAIPDGPVGATAVEMIAHVRCEDSFPDFLLFVGAAAGHQAPPKRLFSQHLTMCRRPPPARGRATA